MSDPLSDSEKLRAEKIAIIEHAVATTSAAEWVAKKIALLSVTDVDKLCLEIQGCTSDEAVELIVAELSYDDQGLGSV